MTKIQRLNKIHKEKMVKMKAIRNQIMKEKKTKKGLIIVNTGDGKGKSSSAFGMIMRCIAHGIPCAVVQFIKGNWQTGEKKILKNKFYKECIFVVSGDGFTWDTQDREADIKSAKKGWEKAKELIKNPKIKFILLDEINIAMKYEYLDVNEIINFLQNEKPPSTHVVLTGRAAKTELLNISDLVTEMKLIKHPFKKGIKAQPGIEF
tara:strand:+ start:543 stop:1160 length:618 start_codon:yes stop_codon:yes gene_type:complete